MSDADIDRPVLAAPEIPPAAGTARAQVTYDNLDPSDPAYPIADGGFWGAFMRILESKWNRTQREHAEARNTFDRDDAEGQTKLVTDGGCTDYSIDTDTDRCPECGSSAFYPNGDAGVFWCEECERECWQDGAGWVSSGVDGLPRRVGETSGSGVTHGDA